ncbi:unnamed protein product [Dicrocoelium dendriticum]|nr:unnamed protein product [Dicrocoelium dendriticum]CAH8431185.1 unnamed protein product [Dicrocoelium dendriticum]
MIKDRWSLRQEHNRLDKAQISIEEERRGLVEQAGRERAELQQLVSTFLEEHRKLQTKAAEERALCAEEHQRLRAAQVAWEEKRREEESALRQAKDEIHQLREALGAERRRLDERLSEVRINEVKLEETRKQLEIVRCDLSREQQSLASRDAYLTEQATELAQRSEAVKHAQRSLSDAEAKQRHLRQEQAKQLAELQEKTERLHEAEQKLIQERKELSRQHIELTKLRQQINVDKTRAMCVTCGVPVRDEPTPMRSHLDSANRSRRALLNGSSLRAQLNGEMGISRRSRLAYDENAKTVDEEPHQTQRRIPS